MNELPIIVREKKITLIIGIFNIVIFSIMLVGTGAILIDELDNEILILAIGSLIFWLMGIYAVVEYYRHRIVIDSEKVQYINVWGKIKEIKIQDIGKITYPYSGFIKMCKIFDKNDKLIISFELVMVNSYEALQYLNKAAGFEKDEADEADNDIDSDEAVK